MSTSESSIPVRTPISTLSTKALSNINVDMIKSLQSFTNINFTSIHNQLLSTSESGGVKARQYHITGTCFQLGFMVEFTVREPSLDLKDVRIEVPRSAQKELGRFVSRAERERMLMPFFRTLAQYAQMDYDRQVLMGRLAKRFPQLVKSSRAIRKLSRASSTGSAAASLPPSGSPAGPGVQTMTFSLAKRSSPELVLQWTIDATGQGKTVPQVRLFPRMPQKWRQADEKMALDGIPTQFVRLMQLKGTEGAAAVVVKCVFGRRAAEAGDTNSDTEIDTDTNGVSA
ncbi:hypothetical protein BGZ99_000878 [Dissophora globulifera]|uniref:Uncharacterized protein n=1 Tax=Dissophora globulifera TaxID=979702 RepID=A0A9P6V0D9_9FUNG|nr:hypothetical protein BGZ99_000878 [Dissophora globulifera]